MDVGARIVAAALALVGTPFRLHGRGAAGVDCVGLALLSVRGAGLAVPEPPPYRLRAGAAGQAGAWMARAGFAVAERPRPGDIILAQVSALQPHLMIEGVDAVVHAHAGIGRVVCMPMPDGWTVAARWRWVGGAAE